MKQDQNTEVNLVLIQDKL